MLKHLTKLLIISIIILFPINSFGKTAKLTAIVVNEEGKPIQNADVTFSFSYAKNGDGGGIANFGVNKKTDEQGLCVGQSETMPYTGVVVDKQNYYRSIQKYEFKKTSGIIFKKWEPWNPTIKVVLKKKRNPVPMIMGNTGGWIHVPKVDTPIGYDLFKSDWVSPFGAGTTTDFTLTCHSDVRAYADYDVSVDLAFADNSLNGIQEYFFDPKDQSTYRWPFRAPVEGYKSNLHKELNKQFPGRGISTNAKKNVNYLFRIRSKVDKKGNLISAFYGKIPGEIGFDAGNKGGCDFSFYYYINPEGTRNIEEDQINNISP